MFTSIFCPLFSQFYLHAMIYLYTDYIYLLFKNIKSFVWTLRVNFTIICTSYAYYQNIHLQSSLQPANIILQLDYDRDVQLNYLCVFVACQVQICYHGGLCLGDNNRVQQQVEKLFLLSQATIVFIISSEIQTNFIILTHRPSDHYRVHFLRDFTLPCSCYSCWSRYIFYLGM